MPTEIKMTAAQAKKVTADIAARVDAAQSSYTVAKDAHFAIPGNFFDTPGSTLDAMTAAWKELQSAILEAKRLGWAVREFGTLTVTDHPQYSSVEFVSKAEARKAAQKNADWRAWENSKA
ncbi:MAG TPA: hypothetical protein VMQ60_01640 [Acidobacteriaceae bacterium]|jgi:hypothetical protein|nr:hypothetical protein [Acidobacteriaceae bacterium]